MEATTKALRLHTAEILAAADRGEEVIITYRGRRRAVIRRWVDPVRDQSRTDRNPAFGLWRAPDGDVAEQVRRLRRRRDLP
jgi:antitoxin (DNA-binding transcriptional repressor) of toxin-antitoxin stability system